MKRGSPGYEGEEGLPPSRHHRSSHRGYHAQASPPGPNISGTWRLDKARSDPLAPYLEAMGLCQIAIDGHQQKEAATETFYTFEQSASGLTTSKASWEGSSRRELHFGKTQAEPGQIAKKASLAIRGDAVVVTTEMGKRTLYDTKTLCEDGNAIKMVLELVTPDDTVTVVRWLVHCGVGEDAGSGAGGGAGAGAAAASLSDDDD